MYSGRLENDTVTVQEINKFCPVAAGGEISLIKCRDDKGEPFSQKYNFTSGDSLYVYSCGKFNDDDTWGAKCKAIKTNGTCPDYSFELTCICDPSKGKQYSNTFYNSVLRIKCLVVFEADGKLYWSPF